MTQLDERFWSKVDRSQYSPGGCWAWLGSNIGKGYGGYSINRKARTAHRLSFIDAGGVLTEEKPNALHRCNNRRCVNPAHVYAGNQKDNVADTIRAGRLNAGGAAVNGRKTHCLRGHLLSGENLYTYECKRGLMRMCRACRRLASKESYHRQNRIRPQLKVEKEKSLAKASRAILSKDEYFGKPNENKRKTGPRLNPLAQPVFCQDGAVLIPLNRSKWNGMYTKISFDDFEKVAAFSWSASWCALSKACYARTGKGSSRKSIHRYILDVSDPEIIIDHVNGDTLDNRRCNLRKTDMRGNAQNKKNNSENLGVSWFRRNPSKCGSRIWVDGRARWLGYFETKEEAAAAYEKASASIHRE